MCFRVDLPACREDLWIYFGVRRVGVTRYVDRVDQSEKIGVDLQTQLHRKREERRLAIGIVTVFEPVRTNGVVIVVCHGFGGFKLGVSHVELIISSLLRLEKRCDGEIFINNKYNR